MPYSYPVPVYGAGYAYPSAYPQYYTDGSYPVDPGPQQPPQPSNVTVIYPPPQQAVPAPDANPEPVSPYEPRDQPAADQALADHYLIALKDHAIYAAVAYWVDGDTLHYFTAGNVHNQASLSLVDRDLTARLNTEAGHEVKLPSAK
jgi:endonuclease YncB( thermonuclease family)